MYLPGFYKPLSRVGQLPDYTGNLPKLSKTDGRPIAKVGHTDLYVAYQFSWNDRLNEGQWHYLYNHWKM